MPPAGVRPTSARVREALFSMVGQDLRGITVLDAFGGSGLLGLEAWSRGATVCIVERSRPAFSAIRRNVDAMGADVVVQLGDVLRMSARIGPFDLVLADPPYAEEPVPIVARLTPLVAGALVLEIDASRPDPESADLVLARRRHYGGTSLCLFQRRGS